MFKLSMLEERKLAGFARKCVKGNDLAHGWDHIECVVKLSKIIGERVKANLKILLAAAYLHDIVSRDETGKHYLHSSASAKKAAKILKEIGFNEREIERVMEAISTSSYESHLKGIEPVSMEAKVLRDADFLDAMGARGIARTFAFAGHYKCPHGLGSLNWDPRNPPKHEMNLEGPDPTAIHHFSSKLLWLKDLMSTEMGRKLAEERHRFMVAFLQRYKEEMEGKT